MSTSNLLPDEGDEEDKTQFPDWAYGACAGGAVVVVGLTWVFHVVVKKKREKDAVLNAKEINNYMEIGSTPRDTKEII